MTAAIETLRCTALEIEDLVLTFYLITLYQVHFFFFFFLMMWECGYWPSSAYGFCFFFAELVVFLSLVSWKIFITLPVQADRYVLVLYLGLHCTTPSLSFCCLYCSILNPSSAKSVTLRQEKRGFEVFREFAFCNSCVFQSGIPKQPHNDINIHLFCKLWYYFALK